MLKKNEVIEALENGGYILLDDWTGRAHVYTVSDGHIGVCRWDTAEKIGATEPYEKVEGYGYNKQPRILNPYAMAAEKAAAAHELSSIRTPGNIEIRAKNDCRIGGNYVAKGRRYIIRVYGDGTQEQPGNAYGSLYDFRTHEHAVYFEILSRPEADQETNNNEEENTMMNNYELSQEELDTQTTEARKAAALAAYLVEYENFTEDEAAEIERDGSGCFSCGSWEYDVLTDEEADEAARGEILDSLWAFRPEFILSHMHDHGPTSIREDEAICKALQIMQEELCESATPIIRALIEDLDDFIYDAIAADGRGHFVSRYDGDEIELGEFYAYRQN